MPLLEINGVRLAVEESQSGEPLVLVHGSWVSRSAWALVEDGLAQRFAWSATTAAVLARARTAPSPACVATTRTTSQP